MILLIGTVSQVNNWLMGPLFNYGIKQKKTIKKKQNQKAKTKQKKTTANKQQQNKTVQIKKIPGYFFLLHIVITSLMAKFVHL